MVWSFVISSKELNISSTLLFRTNVFKSSKFPEISEDLLLFEKYPKNDYHKASIIIYDPNTYSILPFKTNKKIFILKTFESNQVEVFDVKFFCNKRWTMFINDDKKYLTYLRGKHIEDEYKSIDIIKNWKTIKTPINTVVIQENGDVLLSRDIKVNFISGKFKNNTFNT